MGAYLSSPDVTKYTTSGACGALNIKWSACSMQGWRVGMEDTHLVLYAKTFPRGGSRGSRRHSAAGSFLLSRGGSSSNSSSSTAAAAAGAAFPHSSGVKEVLQQSAAAAGTLTEESSRESAEPREGKLLSREAFSSPEAATTTTSLAYSEPRGRGVAAAAAADSTAAALLRASPSAAETQQQQQWHAAATPAGHEGGGTGSLLLQHEGSLSTPAAAGRETEETAGRPHAATAAAAEEALGLAPLLPEEQSRDSRMQTAASSVTTEGCFVESGRWGGAMRTSLATACSLTAGLPVLPEEELYFQWGETLMYKRKKSLPPLCNSGSGGGFRPPGAPGQTQSSSSYSDPAAAAAAPGEQQQQQNFRAEELGRLAAAAAATALPGAAAAAAPAAAETERTAAATGSSSSSSSSRWGFRRRRRSSAGGGPQAADEAETAAAETEAADADPELLLGEDAFLAVETGDVKLALFAVFDGHGGPHVARFCAQHLPEELLQQEGFRKGHFAAALRGAYIAVDELLRSSEKAQEELNFYLNHPTPHMQRLEEQAAALAALAASSSFSAAATAAATPHVSPHYGDAATTSAAAAPPLSSTAAAAAAGSASQAAAAAAPLAAAAGSCPRRNIVMSGPSRSPRDSGDTTQSGSSTAGDSSSSSRDSSSAGDSSRGRNGSSSSARDGSNSSARDGSNSSAIDGNSSSARDGSSRRRGCRSQHESSRKNNSGNRRDVKAAAIYSRDTAAEEAAPEVDVPLRGDAGDARHQQQQARRRRSSNSSSTGAAFPAGSSSSCLSASAVPGGAAGVSGSKSQQQQQHEAAAAAAAVLPLDTETKGRRAADGKPEETAAGIASSSSSSSSGAAAGDVRGDRSAVAQHSVSRTAAAAERPFFDAPDVSAATSSAVSPAGVAAPAFSPVAAAQQLENQRRASVARSLSLTSSASDYFVPKPKEHGSSRMDSEEGRGSSREGTGDAAAATVAATPSPSAASAAATRSAAATAASCVSAEKDETCGEGLQQQVSTAGAAAAAGDNNTPQGHVHGQHSETREGREGDTSHPAPASPLLRETPQCLLSPPTTVSPPGSPEASPSETSGVASPPPRGDGRGGTSAAGRAAAAAVSASPAAGAAAETAAPAAASDSAASPSLACFPLHLMMRGTPASRAFLPAAAVAAAQQQVPQQQQMPEPWEIAARERSDSSGAAAAGGGFFHRAGNTAAGTCFPGAAAGASSGSGTPSGGRRAGLRSTLVNLFESVRNTLNVGKFFSRAVAGVAGGGGPVRSLASLSGCTAITVLVTPTAVVVANVGDSRCVLCRGDDALELSKDHKPQLPEERIRIYGAGGYLEMGRVNGNLNLSRALGDLIYKQDSGLPPERQIVSAVPDVVTMSRDPEKDDFLLIGCDGIWEFLSSQVIVDFVRRRLRRTTDLGRILQELFDQLLSPNPALVEYGCDNMTAILVDLKPRARTIVCSIPPTISVAESATVAADNACVSAATAAPAAATSPAAAAAMNPAATAAGGVTSSQRNTRRVSSPVAAETLTSPETFSMRSQKRETDATSAALEIPCSTAHAEESDATAATSPRTISSVNTPPASAVVLRSPAPGDLFSCDATGPAAAGDPNNKKATPAAAAAAKTSAADVKTTAAAAAAAPHHTATELGPAPDASVAASTAESSLLADSVTTVHAPARRALSAARGTASPVIAGGLPEVAATHLNSSGSTREKAAVQLGTPATAEAGNSVADVTSLNLAATHMVTVHEPHFDTSPLNSASARAAAVAEAADALVKQRGSGLLTTVGFATRGRVSPAAASGSTNNRTAAAQTPGSSNNKAAGAAQKFLQRQQQ